MYENIRVPPLPFIKYNCSLYFGSTYTWLNLIYFSMIFLFTENNDVQVLLLWMGEPRFNRNHTPISWTSPSRANQINPPPPPKKNRKTINSKVSATKSYKKNFVILLKGIRNFDLRGYGKFPRESPCPKFWRFFFFSKGEWDQYQCSYETYTQQPKWATIGPPAKRHLKGASLEVRWWPDIGSFVLFQRFQTSIPEKSYIFVLFHAGGGVPDPLSTHSSGSAHE